MRIDHKPDCVFHPEEAVEGSLRLLDFVHLTCRRSRRKSICLQRLFWGLDYHFQDAGEFSLDGEVWHPRVKGTAHLYAPGIPYWERFSARDIPFTETYVIFHATGVPRLDTLIEAGHGFARFLDSAGTLGARFADLFDAAEGHAGQWQAQGALYGIVDRLLLAQPTETGDYSLAAAPARQPSLSERVDAYIREHYALHLTLEAMAHAMGVSRSTLTHRYRSETGTTPVARLLECRLEIARSMILRGEPLKVVAAHTGFYDEYYLSKAFRRRFGAPPRRYATDASQRDI